MNPRNEVLIDDRIDRYGVDRLLELAFGRGHRVADCGAFEWPAGVGDEIFPGCGNLLRRDLFRFGGNSRP
jgi:hypothetical protein